jgi:hypothetical protein
VSKCMLRHTHAHTLQALQQHVDNACGMCERCSSCACGAGVSNAACTCLQAHAVTAGTVARLLPEARERTQRLESKHTVCEPLHDRSKICTRLSWSALQPLGDLT